MSPEAERLQEARESGVPWKQWGPFLSERQWGTVREDYSADGNAWDFFSHDQARSRAYRWGEDGLAGISNDTQQLCFALALWNGRDPILKERLFGLTNGEGNHGEDVKEYYFYLDSTPTHSYMRYLYKYPQAAYPYNDLVETNRRRSSFEFEYELLDTGVFAQDRYFDVFVEYAKAAPNDMLIAITVHNRGPDPALLHLLPTLWFRNTWSWDSRLREAQQTERPRLHAVDDATILAEHPTLGRYILHCAAEAQPSADGPQPALLFTENETNAAHLWGGTNASPYVKDAFHRCVVNGERDAVNPARTGTKSAAHYSRTLGRGEQWVMQLRLRHVEPTEPTPEQSDPFATFNAQFTQRAAEADEFYAALLPDRLDADAAMISRQALAGMLWGKQYYDYDLTTWLEEHDFKDRFSLERSSIRNRQWFHMVNADIISMPDKWEYPWYAAWDLVFQSVALAMVDLDFAKDQLALMLSQRYLHPNGQIPAYEWSFSDVNPPVHAWATLRVFQLERYRSGEGDFGFLKDVFHKLLLNFTWWVNRKDPENRDVFGGGFLGLDNIGVFDRSAPLPTGGQLDQSDGTAWMAFYALSMLQIAFELSFVDPSYQGLASKFFEHFLWIQSSIEAGSSSDSAAGLWDDEDGFFYDVLRLPDGRSARLKVRSLVGLLPLAATAVVQPDSVSRLPEFMARVRWLNDNRPELVANIPSLGQPGIENRRLLAALNETRLRRVLTRMLDEQEFLSPYGIRSISRIHHEQPYVVDVGGMEHRVDYLPAESNNRMFGGNSNWRGPIWFPMNFILIHGLIGLHAYYGDEFTVECPTGSGQQLTLWQVSQELTARLSQIFRRDEQGHRPVYGGATTFQTDPNWRDHLLFYEYFHGDNGAGLGASHQTGWTGLVAWILALQGADTDFEAVVKQALEPSRQKGG
jgi:hypothetical protein